MITISLIEHRSQERIRIDCEKEQSTMNKIRKIEGRRWSATKKCWHIPYAKSSFNQLQHLFGKENITILNPKKKINPVKIFETLSVSDIKIIEPQFTKYTKNDEKHIRYSGDRILVNSLTNKTIAVYIPYYLKNDIEILKKIDGRQWSPEQQYWTLPLYQETINRLALLPNVHYNFALPSQLPYLRNRPKTAPKKVSTLTASQQEALTILDEKLILERKSWRTIKAYKAHLRGLFKFYPTCKPSEITNEQIKKYLLYKIRNDAIKENTQGQFINAIVAYYKKILNQEVKLEGIKRPKRISQLPNVFSKSEVAILLATIKNIKHQAIIALIYSAGLRRSEVISLRKSDILFQRKCIFIKGGKGKKDRYVFLANKAEEVLKAYFEVYSPRFWLFEGQKGGQYGERSMQSLFDKAKQHSRVNPYVTLHGLRHSFATHLVEDNVPLHVVKELLGHNSVKTTEIYLHISNKYRQALISPLDRLHFETAPQESKKNHL